MTSYYDTITGVKLVDTSLVVDGQTFNIDAKGVVTKAHTPGFYTTRDNNWFYADSRGRNVTGAQVIMVNISILMLMVVKLRVAS